MANRRFPVSLLGLAIAVSASAQFRVSPVAERPDEAALRLMLRKLASVGTFMQTTAHPDDEDNGLLAMLGHGRGIRTVLVTVTRGEGGQNEIGPELSQALSILRTEELLAAHRFDGAEQYFTRAVDFGYSFSIEETLEQWGRQDILADLVRHIRTVRPDVVAGFLCDGRGGGQHHQASTLLTREAFSAAADPGRFPDQIAEGLRPWQAKRLFCTDLASFTRSSTAGPHPTTTIRDVFEPLLGRTYGSLGIEARSMHKCQGTSQLLPLPGAAPSRTYRLQESTGTPPDQGVKDLFEGIDTSIVGLARYAEQAPPTLVNSLGDIAASVAAAERAVMSRGPFAAAPSLAAGLGEVRKLRARLDELGMRDDARFEIDLRLELKERQFEQALVLSQGLQLEVLADDGLVIRGQPLRISTLGRSAAPAEMVVNSLSLRGVDGEIAPCQAAVTGGGTFKCTADVKVGDVPLSTAYWRPRDGAARYDFEPGVSFGVPFRPSPFVATLSLTIAGTPVTVERTVQYRYDDLVAGEKRMELLVVPPLAVTTAPDIAVIPQVMLTGTHDDRGIGARRKLAVRVVNHERGAASGNVTLNVPAGWNVSPERAAVSFSREDESVTLTFSVTPPATAVVGEYPVAARIAESGDPGRFSQVGYDAIEYPHVRRRHLVKEARSRVAVMDVAITSNVRVGYIMGVGDRVPEAIEQLASAVHLIDSEELASGDLSRYPVIMTGVRAYERRADLCANNHRLLEYAAAGGTVLVQYNKLEFNQAQYGPYPARVSSDRVTDEAAPVEVLVPGHPVFATPNRIDDEAWAGWIQERGLYFLGERDPRYTDLVRLADPFELNPGPKTGALVEAKVGQGRWIYIGLGLWRQLPAGTPGAYKLLANLLSLGSRP
ncbi:MAG TPA: PIG-L family deacetylase [Vicinamibacterales bacterium]|nr:PIG-L family deacetylase [Vicinamibacterales bacterium]